MSRESSRFAMLVFSMWVASAMGIMWSFGVISNELKEQYKISQSTMTWITTSGSAFGMFGLPAGLVFDFFGPPGALLVGGTVTGVGSMLLSIALYCTEQLNPRDAEALSMLAMQDGYPAVVASSLDGVVAVADGVHVGADNDTTTAAPLTTPSDAPTTTTVPSSPAPTTTPSGGGGSDAEPKGALALIFIGYIMLLHGTTYLDVGGVMATLFVFPLDRGDVVMLTRTLTGLGGTFFVFLFNGFFAAQLSSAPAGVEASKVYGRYMFVCSAIILGICWSAAAVIRYPIYHTSGFAAWRQKRNALTAVAKGSSPRQSGGLRGLTRSFFGNKYDGANSHVTITDKSFVPDANNNSSHNNGGFSAASSPQYAAEDERRDAEEALQTEKDAAKAYYTSVRAAPRRLAIALFVLASVFGLFTTVAFMKAGKENLPESIVTHLFGPDGNRAVSITSMCLLLALLPMMALPASSSSSAPQREASFANNNNSRIHGEEDDAYGNNSSSSSSCLCGPGNWLDRRSAPSASAANSVNRNSGQYEAVDGDDEAATVNEGTGLVAASSSPVITNPTYHKNACQFRTSFKETVTTIPLMWTLMLFAFLSWGAGATIISNSAQILRAVNDNKFDEDLNNLMTSVVGVGTAVGRIFVGVVDRYYYHQVRYSSAIALPVGPLAMMGGALMIVFLPARVSYFGIAATAFGYGLSWASTMLLVREAFERDIGRVYYMCSTTAVVSVVAFNRGLFGTIFDDRGREQGLYPNCSGVDCVKIPMLVGAGLFALGSIFAIITYIQWRRRLLA